MNSMLLGLCPLLIIATWGAGAVLLERATHFRRPLPHVITALLCVGVCLAAIAALAWATPQPGQNWSDAPLRQIAPHEETPLDDSAVGR